MCFGLISVLLYLGIQFHFHMVVFIPFKTKKAKHLHFFLVQNFFSSDSQYILGNASEHTSLDLSKTETFMGTILFGRLGKDCELPDATFASEDDQQSLAHKVVLTSTTQKWCLR